MKNRPIIEACVETVEQAIMAQSAGADRIELCASLEVGGITPPIKLLDVVRSVVDLPIMAMVRPRGGDFVHSPEEVEDMIKSIELFKRIGIKGVVFGFLLKNGEIDIELTKRMAELASPMEVTFHKAIDVTPDPVASLQSLVPIERISRVLTSGGAKTAWEGRINLKKMNEAAGNDLTILAAGSVTKSNLEQLHQAINCREYHGRRIVF